MKKAWEDIKRAKRSFELAGHIVVTPTDPETSGVLTENQVMSKELLVKMHEERIQLANMVYICNVGGYIGESTHDEIDQAIRLGKSVHYAYPL